MTALGSGAVRRQAATIEETSAAVEALAANLADNAIMAADANETSKSTTHSAEISGEVMGEANAAMDRIAASSAKISNIIGMIDDIAFQTNPLALNVAVEAAGAGNAGCVSQRDQAVAIEEATVAVRLMEK